MSTNMPDSEVDLRTYLRVLRRRKWWVIVCTGLALAGAIAYSFSATKEYSATAQLLVQPQSGTLPLTTPGPDHHANGRGYRAPTPEERACRRCREETASISLS